MNLRLAHLRNIDLYELALAGNLPEGVEMYSPERARLIARGRASVAIKQARLARDRAMQLKGLPIGDDCARWYRRELQEVSNARRDHTHFIGTSLRELSGLSRSIEGMTTTERLAAE